MQNYPINALLSDRNCSSKLALAVFSSVDKVQTSYVTQQFPLDTEEFHLPFCFKVPTATQVVFL